MWRLLCGETLWFYLHSGFVEVNVVELLFASAQFGLQAVDASGSFPHGVHLVPVHPGGARLDGQRLVLKNKTGTRYRHFLPVINPNLTIKVPPPSNHSVRTQSSSLLKLLLYKRSDLLMLCNLLVI